jgi:hypothetical protein
MQTEFIAYGVTMESVSAHKYNTPSPRYNELNEASSLILCEDPFGVDKRTYCATQHLWRHLAGIMNDMRLVFPDRMTPLIDLSNTFITPQIR